MNAVRRFHVILFRKTSTALLVLAALCSGAQATENRAYFSMTKDPRLPACDSASVHSAVAGTLARARADYADGRTITIIEDTTEVRYQENDVSPLARRYCRGTANLSDGKLQTVHYKLVEHAGFIGIGWAVEACLSPLDKWRVYGAYCSTTRPR